MTERPKIEYIKVNVADNALVGSTNMGSVFKMPDNGEYAGYDYFVFKDKIKRSRQITDLKATVGNFVMNLLSEKTLV